MRAGRTSTASAKSTKFARMVKTLAGAARTFMRNAVLACKSLSIQQDVRKAQLLIQFSCSDENLNHTTGCLGQCDLTKADFGLSARGVFAGTAYIVHKFAVSEQLCDAVRTKTDLFAADGAYDEQLAGILA